MSRTLLFEKLLTNLEIESIHGYKILIVHGDIQDYAKGISLVCKELLKFNDAHVSIVITPIKENNLINATTSLCSVNLERVFLSLEAKGSRESVSFYTKGELDTVKNHLKRILYRELKKKFIAGKIMTFPVKSIQADYKISDVKQNFETFGYSILTVKENEKFVGTISFNDINKANKHGFSNEPVSTFMNTDPKTITPDATLEVIFETLVINNLDSLPVVDEDNKILGIITKTDLLQALYRQKELKKGDLQNLIGTEKNLEDLIKTKMSKYFQGLLFLMGQVADKQELSVYVVGGFVRDLILGIYSKDIDIVVEGDALRYAKKINELLRGKYIENEELGTAQIITEKQRIDFASSRQEFYIYPEGVPKVEKANLRRDLFRRDFTINTMAFQINIDNFGAFFDFYNAVEDIEKGQIRILYNLSFVEDPLRIIRAIRFENRFNFSIEKDTISLINSAIKSKMLDKVSKDRFWKEMMTVFKEENVSRLVERLFGIGALQQIFPNTFIDEEKIRILNKVEEIILWAKEEDDKFNPIILYICAILYGERNTDIPASLRKIKLPHKDIEVIVYTLEKTAKIINIFVHKGVSREEVYKIFNSLPRETVLFLLAASNNSAVIEYYNLYIEKLVNSTPVITGHNLKNMGYNPGPIFSEILEFLKMERVRGNINSLDDEIFHINKFFSKEKGS